MRRLAFLLALGVALGTGVPGAGASAARPVANASGVDAGALEPTLSCTSRDDPAKGVDTTVFGYVNHSETAVRLDVGTWNLLIDAPGTKPPTRFKPGKHPHAFEVHVARGTVPRWELGTGEVKGPGPRCKGRVSPVLAGSIMRGTIAGGLPLAFVWFVFTLKRRRDKKLAATA